MKRLLLSLVAVAVLPAQALAHGVARGDAGYIQAVSGFLPIPFAYPGAKHVGHTANGKRSSSAVIPSEARESAPTQTSPSLRLG